MAEHAFTKAEDMLTYCRRLQDAHKIRDRQILELQGMWQMPIRTADSGRTIWINNEPWTATRMIVNLGCSGRLVHRAFAPPDPTEDGRERAQALSGVERLLSAHWQETDRRMRRNRRQGHRRQMFYFMAVHGWHAGIDLLLDGTKSGEWPMFSDIWNPLDTHPDMESTALVHRSRIRYGKLRAMFGDRRPNGMKPVPGWELKLMKNRHEHLPDDTDVLTYDYWDGESEMIIGLDSGGRPLVIKSQTEHGFEFNPAYCQPLDAVPFNSTALDQMGNVLSQPDPWSTEWMGYVGQSPMIGYKTAYRYASELAEQIAGVVERWANPMVLVKTAEGKWVPFDTSNPDPTFLENTTIVDVVKPPTFPGDDRAWFAAVQDEIAKASFSRQAYGQVGNSEAAQTMQLINLSSDYIVNPLIQQSEGSYDDSANNLLRMIDMRGGQYAKKLLARGVGSNGKATMYYVDLKDVPEGTQVTAELKGAGIKQDKLQTLLAITQAVNAGTRPLSLETMLDMYLDIEAPEDEIGKMIEELMIMNPKVIGAISPLATLYDYADRFREKQNPRAKAIAAVLDQQAAAALDDIQRSAAAQPAPATPPAPTGPPAPPPGAPPEAPPPTSQLVGPNGQPLALPPGMGGPPPPQPMLPGPGGVMGGIPPTGAPPPGSIGPPTGFAALQGVLQALQSRQAGVA